MSGCECANCPALAEVERLKAVTDRQARNLAGYGPNMSGYTVAEVEAIETERERAIADRDRAVRDARRDALDQAADAINAVVRRYADDRVGMYVVSADFDAARIVAGLRDSETTT